MKWLDREISTDWFENLILYIEVYDSDYSARIAGASEEQVAELESLVGRPLPETYKTYLLNMGEDSGGLLDPVPTMDLEIDAAIESYQEMRDNPDIPPLPENCIQIGCGVHGGYEDICLQMPEEGEARLVETAGSDVLRTIARNFPRFLYQQAFNKFELGSFSDVADYTLRPKIHKLHEAAQAAEQAGFAPKWFSDTVHWCGWAEGVRISLRKPKAQHGWLRIAGNSARETAEYGRKLETSMGITLRGKFGHKWG